MMSQTLSLMEEWCAAWSAHDMARVCAVFTEDCVYEDVALGLAHHGHEELTRFGVEFFKGFPDVKFTLTLVVFDDQRGSAEWRMSGTHKGELPGMPPPNGGTCDLRGVSYLEVRDGKISRCSDYTDNVALMRQLGHIS
jgi:steroid delta-isomerase-like uncharacterized protein